jgi:hypothetical protein
MLRQQVGSAVTELKYIKHKRSHEMLPPVTRLKKAQKAVRAPGLAKGSREGGAMKKRLKILVDGVAYFFTKSKDRLVSPQGTETAGNTLAEFARPEAEPFDLLADFRAGRLPSFLAAGNYRLVSSRGPESMGCFAIEFASDTMMWRLVRDEGEFFLNCRRLGKKGLSGERYSLDLLIRLVTGVREDSTPLTEDSFRWLEANLAEVEDRFSDSRLLSTVDELQELRRQRSKEMFPETSSRKTKTAPPTTK